jgi:hypothetical protein
VAAAPAAAVAPPDPNQPLLTPHNVVVRQALLRAPSAHLTSVREPVQRQPAAARARVPRKSCARRCGDGAIAARVFLFGPVLVCIFLPLALFWSLGVCLVAVPVLLSRKCQKKPADQQLCPNLCVALQYPFYFLYFGCAILGGVDLDDD